MAGTSSQEWGTEIVALDKLVVEGLKQAYLKRLAGVLGIEPQKLPQLRGIALLEEIAQARDVAPDLVRSMVDPLWELQALRSKLGSHRKGQEAAQIEKQLRQQYGGLTAHHRDLVKQVYQAMLTLADLIKQGYFNAPPTTPPH
jgi:MoxR-like ATPase